MHQLRSGKNIMYDGVRTRKRVESTHTYNVPGARLQQARARLPRVYPKRRNNELRLAVYTESRNGQNISSSDKQRHIDCASVADCLEDEHEGGQRGQPLLYALNNACSIELAISRVEPRTLYGRHARRS